MAVLQAHTASPAVPAPQTVTDIQQLPPASDLAAHRIVNAQSEDGLLTWSYTVGLREAYHHQEFLLTGLDPFLAETVLSQLIAQVAEGHVFTESSSGRDLLHRLTCAFREVPVAMAGILMPLAANDQSGQAVTALQCVYPDNKNRLPWHFGYNNSWHEVQPIFGSDFPLTRVEINMLRAAAGIHSVPAQHIAAQHLPVDPA